MSRAMKIVLVSTFLFSTLISASGGGCLHPAFRGLLGEFSHITFITPADESGVISFSRGKLRGPSALATSFIDADSQLQAKAIKVEIAMPALSWKEQVVKILIRIPRPLRGTSIDARIDVKVNPNDEIQLSAEFGAVAKMVLQLATLSAADLLSDATIAKAEALAARLRINQGYFGEDEPPYRQYEAYLAALNRVRTAPTWEEALWRYTKVLADVERPSAGF